jgi:hypothetical protein
LSLGHAVFFSLGGYAMGMYLMRQIGPRGVYGDPVLPDFMVFLNWKSLPWFWYGFNHFWFAVPMMVLAPAALAWVFGWFAFDHASRRTFVHHQPELRLHVRPTTGLAATTPPTSKIFLFRLHSDKRASLLMITVLRWREPQVPRHCYRGGRAMRADAYGRRGMGYPAESFKLWPAVSGHAVRQCRRLASSTPASWPRQSLKRLMGCRRRTRHAIRRGHRSRIGELRKDILDRRIP